MRDKFFKKLIGLILLITISTSAQINETNPYLPQIFKHLPENFFRKPISNEQIMTFFAKYPKLVLYKIQLFELYKKNRYSYIWYDKNGRKEFADVLYNKINNLNTEGIRTAVPYKNELDEIFNDRFRNFSLEGELFLSSYYFYYTNKVVQGFDKKRIDELEWYLPRKKQCFTDYIDSLLINPKTLKNERYQINQYVKLKRVLNKYQQLAKNGGWKFIKNPEKWIDLNPNDSSEVITQLRSRLFQSGELSQDNKRNVYDEELKQAVLKFKKAYGFSLSQTIQKRHIDALNVPIDERIKTIIVNMERCRWGSPEIVKSQSYIMINIPSYNLIYFKEGKIVLKSEVVVGNTLNKTVVFSGMMSNIVFNPYWNIPNSILENEILPAIKKNENYLTEKNMEWHNGKLRQKPGPNNSLGLVKFLFPNTNNIYLHDTPSKSLFKEENRAFSHGCIRVAKPIELAESILENDPVWTPEKIKEILDSGEEKWCPLSNKIPVYIGYFTAWVDEEGSINFYKDVYKRDSNLANLLLED